MQSILNEVQILQSLNHPNVVHYYDAMEASDRVYLLMQVRTLLVLLGATFACAYARPFQVCLPKAGATWKLPACPCHDSLDSRSSLTCSLLKALPLPRWSSPSRKRRRSLPRTASGRSRSSSALRCAIFTRTQRWVRSIHIVGVDGSSVWISYVPCSLLSFGSLQHRNVISILRQTRLFLTFITGIPLCSTPHICSHGNATQVVHRDLKPGNIMVDWGDHVTVTDFGLAKQKESETSMMQSSVGTMQYSCPEVIQNHEYVSAVRLFITPCPLEHSLPHSKFLLLPSTCCRTITRCL